MEIYRKRGFTLLEVIVSITILAIISLSLYQFFFATQSFGFEIHKKEISLLLAERKAEHIIAGIENDTISIDTLNNIIYRTFVKINEEIPPLCSVKVFVYDEKMIELQFIKPL